jgi:hypothetical protein
MQTFIIFNIEIIKIKDVEMDRTCSMHEANKNVFLIRFGNCLILESKIFIMFAV